MYVSDSFSQFWHFDEQLFGSMASVLSSIQILGGFDSRIDRFVATNATKLKLKTQSSSASCFKNNAQKI